MKIKIIGTKSYEKERTAIKYIIVRSIYIADERQAKEIYACIRLELGKR